MKTKITFFDVELDLDHLNFDDLIKYVQSETDCTLVENNRFEFITHIENEDKELIEWFEKNTLSKIQRQTIIENLINDINAGKSQRLLKV